MFLKEVGTQPGTHPEEAGSLACDSAVVFLAASKGGGGGRHGLQDGP